MFRSLYLGSYTIGNMKNEMNYDRYYYDGEDLGLSYQEHRSIFKLWAPFVQDVKIYLYSNPGEYDLNGEVHSHEEGIIYPMQFDPSSGVWEAEIAEDLAGQYYLYKIVREGHPDAFQVDPYAHAVSANGQRTYICAIRNTDPEGFRSHSKPPLDHYTDAIIYEVHVRDFSIQETSGMIHKGKFLAFTEEDTISKDGLSTGLDHLKELGVTHVQIMPSYDYQTVNELIECDPQQEGARYNWGYDPMHYNALEGSYATDPVDPSKRIEEFKRMVMALHKAGIRVIMDVVYNHTYEVYTGPFERLIPGYAYRHLGDGTLANGSGTGNEIASEKPMIRKYILDSVNYWLDEFLVDGFRFDLMGLIDTDTMYTLARDVRAKHGEDILLLGEPWQAGGSPLPKSKQFLKGKQRSHGIGVFNDHFRNGVKGGSDDDVPGFALGGLGYEEDVILGLEGGIRDFAFQPEESIQYVTAHDNLILWDKIIRVLHLEKESRFLDLHDGKLMGLSKHKYKNIEEAVSESRPYASVEIEHLFLNEAVRRHILAHALVLTAQGVPFLHAGEEFLRTKFGDHNSYKSPDAINQIRWENKKYFAPVFKYFQGLIAIRKNHPAFRLRTRQEIGEYFQVLKIEEQLIITGLGPYAGGDSWKDILCVYNGSMEEREVFLPGTGPWHIVANDTRAGLEVLDVIEGSRILVSPLAILIMYKE